MKSTLALAATLFILLAVSTLARAADPVAPDSAPTAPAAKTLTLDLGNNVKLKLTTIPAGKFLMGSPKDEKDRKESEGPAREVTISKPFCMAIYPVTQEQYQAMMGTNPTSFKGNGKGPTVPVDTVSWDNAVEFCKKVSAKTHKQVRLPSEAEWEYACRAGTKTRFYFGDDEKQLGDYGWFRGNSNASTHPVGQKKPNAWGLYDMAGNIGEWCSDWYGPSYLKASRKDPEGPATGNARVFRGGFWDMPDPSDLRSAKRYMCVPGGHNFYVGFRVIALGAGTD